MSDEELTKLAGILNVPEDKLREKIQKVKSSYVPTVLANDLTQDIVTKIEEQRNDLPACPSKSSRFATIRIKRWPLKSRLRRPNR